MNLSQFTQEIEASQLGHFAFKEDSYGNTQEFIAADLQNSKDYHRSIKFTFEDGLPQLGLWKIEQGCFNGYGKSLNEAVTQVQSKTSDCVTKAFLAPTYD